MKRIPCKVWKAGEEYVAAQDRALVHAFGRTPSDAMFQLSDRLIDQYEFLDALDSKRLCLHSRKALGYLAEALDSRKYAGFVLIPQ